MTQNVCVYFEEPLDFEGALKPLLVEQLYSYKRLSHIGALRSPKAALWSTRWKPIEITKDVQDRMIRKHVVNDNEELYALIDDLCNEHLPKDLPLWIFHYIQNNKGFSCWLWRVSHGIGDGIRLVPIAANLLQDADGKPIGAPSIGVLQGGQKQIKRNKNKINWLNPKTYYNLIQDIGKIHYSINGPCDTLNAFKPDGKVHGPKRQIHVRNKVPMNIDDVKLLKNKFGVSFNDVITYLCCSGIRSYILSKDS